MCWFEWGRASAAPSLLLLHATGFHARVWDQVIAALPTQQHVVAIDLPGHGRSYRPETLSDWDATARTLAQLIDHALPHAYLGAGHSMGGHQLLRIAAIDPARLLSATLIDPVIMDPAIYAPGRSDFPEAADHPVARRRARWASVEAMIAHFADRAPYSLWQGDVLADYCRHGLLPADDGDGWELACPPAMEVSIYTSAVLNSPLHLLDAVRCPVSVIRAKRSERASVLDFTASPTWSELAARLPDATDHHWDDLTHFIPMQAPARLATFLAQRLAAAKQG